MYAMLSPLYTYTFHVSAYSKNPLITYPNSLYYFHVFICVQFTICEKVFLLWILYFKPRPLRIILFSLFKVY